MDKNYQCTSVPNFFKNIALLRLYHMQNEYINESITG